MTEESDLTDFNKLNNKNKYRENYFSFFKTGLIGKPLTRFDWIIFLTISLFCWLAYCHQDILNTGASSFTYLIGHISDFYDYNYINQIEPMNNYMPSTYLIFALWNLPLYLLGIKRVPGGGSPFIAVMWFKLLPILFFLATGLVLYKIGNLVGFGEKKSKILTYLFLTTPVAFFGPVIFGQYDSFTIFFVVLGFYYYLKNDEFRFVLFFSIAVTFKYFALLVFLPLVVLKEKNILKIMKKFVLFLVPLFLECLFYIKSPMFHKGVLSFASKDNLFLTRFQLGLVDLSLFLVVWTLLLCFAYYKKIDSANFDEFFKWSVYFSTFASCLIFSIGVWHPQWLIFAVPFMILSTMLNKSPKLFIVIDLFMFILFICFCVLVWQNGVDQHMLSRGIFKKFMSPVNVDYGIPVMMCDFVKFGSRSIYYSIISALFLINLILKHPKFCVEKINCDFQPIVNCWGLVRARFLTVVGVWIVPTMACLIISICSPFYILQNSRAYRGDSLLANLKNAQVSQVFVPPDDFEVTDFKILMFSATGRQIEVNSNTTLQLVKINITVNELDNDGNVIKQMSNNDYEIVSNMEIKPIKFKLPNPIHMESNKRYRIDLNVLDDNGYPKMCVCKTFGGFSEDNHAVVDKILQGYSWCIDILGRKWNRTSK